MSLEFEAGGIKFRIVGTTRTDAREKGSFIYHDMVMNTVSGEVKNVRTSVTEKFLKPKP